MGVIPKSTPGEFRIIQDLSFPRNQPNKSSVNDDINTDDFQCDWGTFAACVLLVIAAPVGAEASVNDVEKAFRIIPVYPLDQPHLVVMWDGLLYLDHCTAFGTASSPGLFGRVADAGVRIFKRHGIQDVIKWVDDFVFWRYPSSTSTDGTHSYSYNESLIFNVAENLGLPWSRAKHTPFASTFTYNGFLWDIPARTVQLPPAKKKKYLARLSQWNSSHLVSIRETEQLVGTLNHCCLALPSGRSHLASLYRLSSKLSHCSSTFVRLPIPATVQTDISWWQHTLSAPFCGHTLTVPPPATDLTIFVDASTSWGVGLVINNRWTAWYLLSGWKSDGRDIGWAEMVAVELALCYLVAKGVSNVSIQLHSDNQGVVGALKAGFSRSHQQNHVLQRIVALFASSGIWADTVYVPTTDNVADGPSRGVFPPPSYKLPTVFSVSNHLAPYLRQA